MTRCMFGDQSVRAISDRWERAHRSNRVCACLRLPSTWSWMAAVCVCVRMMHCLKVPEYISHWNRCVVVFFHPHPSVGSSQMAICKTRPSVSPLPRLTALPCTAPLPRLSSPLSSSHHSFYFLSSLSLLSFPYLACTLHPWLSVSLRLFSVSLSRSNISSLSTGLFLLHNLLRPVILYQLLWRIVLNIL